MKTTLTVFTILSVFIINTYAHAEYESKVCKKDAAEYNKTAPYGDNDMSSTHKECVDKDQSVVLSLKLSDKYLSNNSISDLIKQGTCKADWKYSNKAVIKVSNSKDEHLYTFVVNRSECPSILAKE